MRCDICDKALSDTEVVFNKELVNPDGTGGYEPCATCLEIAMDAAFSQGFNRPDDEIATEVGDEFGDGIVETLDTDVSLSDYQEGDASDMTRYDTDDYD